MKKCVLVLLIFMLSVFLLEGEAADMNKQINREKESNRLLEIDNQISKASAEKNIFAAFHPFLTEDSLLLPVKGQPVCGKNACEKLLSQVEIKGWEGKPRWEPLRAEVSEARDLGYTLGRFERPANDAGAEAKTTQSYYYTVWKKDDAGEWKVAFSHGLLLLKDLNLEPLAREILPDQLAQLDEKSRQVAETELAFAKYSVENGIPQAFHRFIADSGITLAPVGPPRTKESYAKTLASLQEQKNPASKRTLDWKPAYVWVSASGEMAYDYGPYIFKATDEKGKPVEGRGYFVTIWKKQPDNTWKFILDAGNEL